jgi:hypothetical protein
MTLLKAVAFGFLLAVCTTSFAQEHKLPVNEPDYNKPKLFADLPQKMNLHLAALENLFQLQVGSTVTLQVTDALVFEGTIVSKSDAQEAGVKSIVIRSTNRQGATFTFTKTNGTSGTPSYIGRIMSRNNSDAYEIAMEKGQYVLQKKNLYDMISE